MEQQRIEVVGKLGSTYAIRGWLRIYSSTEQAESILACDGTAAFGGSTFGFDGLFADEKTDGGYLEKSCGQKAALDFFCFWYAELSVYLFCGHPIFQCRHGNGVAVLGAFADFGGCVLQGKALAS